MPSVCVASSCPTAQLPVFFSAFVIAHDPPQQSLIKIRTYSETVESYKSHGNNTKIELQEEKREERSAANTLLDDFCDKKCNLTYCCVVACRSPITVTTKNHTSNIGHISMNDSCLGHSSTNPPSPIFLYLPFLPAFLL